MDKTQFEEKITELAFLVIAFFGWGIVIVICSAVFNVSGISIMYRFFVDTALFTILAFGVCFTIIRIYQLVHQLEDPEELEPTD